jgi:hypothetical protein
MQYFGTSLGVIVKGKLQQRWSTIPPILVSIKGTTISCLRSSIELKKSPTPYDIGNQGRGLGWAQKKYGRIYICTKL